jgi:hypothetical protein
MLPNLSTALTVKQKLQLAELANKQQRLLATTVTTNMLRYFVDQVMLQGTPSAGYDLQLPLDLHISTAAAQLQALRLLTMAVHIDFLNLPVQPPDMRRWKADTAAPLPRRRTSSRTSQTAA